MPNKYGTNNLRGNYSSKTREENDFYATCPSSVRPIFEVESFTDVIYEPACGMGHLAEVAKNEYGYKVVSSDLIDRGYGEVKSFFDIKRVDGDIVTNPPFRLKEEFVYHAMEILPENGKLALFLNMSFLESKKRESLFEKYPPVRIHVFSRKAQTAKDGCFEKYKHSVIFFAWFVWEKGFSGKPTLDWIKPIELPSNK